MHASNISIPGQGRSTYIIAILFLAWLFAYIDRQVIGLLADTQVSMLQGIAFSSVFALAGLPLGRVANRSNSIIYVLYACLFIIGYTVSAWAPTILMRVHGMSPRSAGATYAMVMSACSSTAYIFLGILSDFLSKRRPLDRRILLPIFLPVRPAAMATFFFASSVTVTVAMLAGSSLSTGLGSTSSLPALQDIAPNGMRGQIVAVYLLMANIIGLGLAPTLVGLVTDRVLHNEMLVQQSSALVAFVAALLALALALTLLGYYRGTRLAMQDDAS